MSVHFEMPFRIDGDRARTVIDGSAAEIVQNVDVLCRTQRGERLARPEYGLEDPTFEFSERVPDQAEIVAAAAEYEERAALVFPPKRIAADGTVTHPIEVTPLEVD